MVAASTKAACAEWPKISVMVPTYNQARFLEEAVASALAQDYPNLEIVISDDASTDETTGLVQLMARDPRVKAFRNVRNIGRVANYRRLLGELATGDWVLNLDGDDCLIGTGYLRAAMTLAASDPAIVLVMAKALSGSNPAEAETVLNDPRSIGRGRLTAIPHVMPGNDFFLKFPPFETIVPLHATCLYQRASALEIGFFTQDILSSDFESFYRLMLGRKVGFVDEIAALWRQHGANATQTMSYEDLRRNAAVFEGPFHRAQALGCFPERIAEGWLRRCRARYLVSMAAQVVRRGVPLAHAVKLGADLIRQDWRIAVEVGPAAWRAVRDRNAGRGRR